MYFAVISIMPDMFTAIRNFGITGRAIQQGKVHLDCINPRDFTNDNYQRVDERTFGGGPGMVMMADPLAKAISYAKELALNHQCVNCPVVYLSPQGQTLDETSVMQMTDYDGIILLCGRYEGIDQRLLDLYVDREISIGDYVLTGGELPAMVMMDCLIRRLPNVMGDKLSAEQDSFADGLLDYPHYTKPTSFKGVDVPEVLLSGHHANIAKWRFIQQVDRTRQLRPDLWKKFNPSKEQLTWLESEKIDLP